MARLIEKDGLRIYRADVDEYLIMQGNPTKELILGVNVELSDIEVVKEVNYTQETFIPISDNLEINKERFIKESKTQLSKYLENNPLFSKVKCLNGKYYNVTHTKQQELMNRLYKYNLFPDYKLYWNATGEPDELWDYEELVQLCGEIENYVRPLIQAQQKLETLIRECNTLDAISTLTINPYEEVYR